MYTLKLKCIPLIMYTTANNIAQKDCILSDQYLYAVLFLIIPVISNSYRPTQLKFHLLLNKTGGRGQIKILRLLYLFCSACRPTDRPIHLIRSTTKFAKQSCKLLFSMCTKCVVTGTSWFRTSWRENTCTHWMGIRRSDKQLGDIRNTEEMLTSNSVNVKRNLLNSKAFSYCCIPKIVRWHLPVIRRV
jgi:hypothetical protein